MYNPDRPLHRYHHSLPTAVSLDQFSIFHLAILSQNRSCKAALERKKRTLKKTIAAVGHPRFSQDSLGPPGPGTQDSSLDPVGPPIEP